MGVKDINTMVSKKDIEKARNAYWLKEAQKQLGKKIKSLDQVKVVERAKKPRFSLGETLAKKAKQSSKGMSAYKRK